MTRYGSRSRIPSLVCAAVALFGLAVPAAAEEETLAEALESIAAGRYIEAAEALTAIVEEDHVRPDVHHLLGLTYLRLDDLDKAEYFVQLAVNLSPEDVDLRYDLALVHYRRVRYRRAIAVLDQAAGLARSREMPRIQRLRGLSYARLRDWGGAIKDLKPAMKQDPDAGTLIQLGRAYMGKGDDKRAVDAFRRAQALDPTRGEAYRLASEALVRIAQDTKGAKKKQALYEEALAEAESLLTVRPMSWQSWYQAGRAAIGARDNDKAEEYLRQVVAERPDYCLAWLNLARIYQVAERADEAIEAIREAEACAPELAPSIDLDDLDPRDAVELADAGDR